MQVNDVSIIVLTAGNPDRARHVVESYAAAGIQDRLRVQFVFLVNRKDLSFALDRTSVSSADGAEVIHVGNDRYFGSAEENLFRIRDIVDVLKPVVLVIGETEELNWTHLADAAAQLMDNKFDALLLNIHNVQKKRSGGTSTMFAAHGLNEDSRQHAICRSLLSGRTVSSDIAFPAALSMFGPIDWLAFIGSHLYSRGAFRGILKYRITERLYSFVYMQALYFTERSRRYSLFMPEVVYRISNDFVTENAGRIPDLGWLREHRVVSGQSETVWFSNVHHLLQIEDERLFAVITFSLNLTYAASGTDDGIVLGRNSMLRQLLTFLNQVINEKFNGSSFYFNRRAPSRLDDELWAGHRFLKRLVRSAECYGAPTRPFFVEKIENVLTYTSLYFDDVEQSADMLLEASSALVAALGVLNDEVLRHFHATSFRTYVQQRTLGQG